MSNSMEVDPTSTTVLQPPAGIPPRTSSHGVTISSPNESPPPRRRTGKRPVSTSSENWQAQSAGKRPLSSHPTSGGGGGGGGGGGTRGTGSSAVVMGAPPLFAPDKLASHSESPEPQPQSPLRSIRDDLIHSHHAPWTEEKEKILIGPYEYLEGHPGKDIRAQLIAAFQEWLKVPEEKLTIITKVIGMLHTASLLVDDVEDSSLLRRGAPVAHNIFGTPQVINSANYVYFIALRELSTLKNPVTIHIFSEELINLHRGQGMDLYWRDSLTCPTEADYLQMVSNKTGGLFRLAIKLMQAESGVISHAQSNGKQQQAAQQQQQQQQQQIDCVPLINTIGLLFQVLDDLLNLSSPTYHARKGHAEDLTEGKFSFPIIHAIRSDPSNLLLPSVLRQRTADTEVKRYAVDYMERRGSFEYTRRVIAELERKAVREVGRLEAKIGGEQGKAGGAKIRDILGKLKAL